MNATTTSAPTPHLSLEPVDPRSLMARAITTATDALRAIRPEQWGASTPCDDMNVGQVAEHMVMVIRRIACAGRGEPWFGWPMDAADVAPGDWADAFAAEVPDLESSWPDAVLDRPTGLPWGEFPGREVLGVYVNELSVHTWDVARATGQDVAWDPAVLDFALVAIHDQLPMADRGPMWAEVRAGLPEGVGWDGDPFANAVDVPDDAPAIDRLVAWNGRTP